MRRIWLAVILTTLACPNRARDRAALLEADRAPSVFADDAAYLHPGAPIVRGRDAIRAIVTDSLGPTTWTPEYADVSDDGSLGYTYGWTRQGDLQGKYLACWRKQGDQPWRIIAYTRTRPATGGTAPPPRRDADPSRAVRGQTDAHELISADSAFSALSVARGAQAAFVAFAADQAVLLGQGGAPMTHGRDAIGAVFAQFPTDAVLEWTPVAANVAGSGDLGCTVGEALIRARGTYSKYLTVWKRQADASWKFVADGGNARPAP